MFTVLLKIRQSIVCPLIYLYREEIKAGHFLENGKAGLLQGFLKQKLLLGVRKKKKR